VGEGIVAGDGVLPAPLVVRTQGGLAAAPGVLEVLKGLEAPALLTEPRELAMQLHLGRLQVDVAHPVTPVVA
jgi:hypothetical protein